MKTILQLERRLPMIGLATDIVYQQKMYWCHCSARPLRMSVMAPRQHYPGIDPTGRWPLIVFLCGGAWQKVDHNAWLPNLVAFVEHGYAVASVEYSVLPYTEHPEQVMEIKAAIRYIRAHAEVFSVDPGRIAIMGESAGGYLAGLAALTGDDPQYKDTHDPAQSDAVQAAVCWYPPTGLQLMDNSGLRVRVDNFPDLCGLVSPKSPPFLLLHGLADSQVPYQQSERLYDALQTAGIRSDLYQIDGADHADCLFVQPEMKGHILDFLDDTLGNRPLPKDSAQCVEEMAKQKTGA